MVSKPITREHLSELLMEIASSKDLVTIAAVARYVGVPCSTMRDWYHGRTVPLKKGMVDKLELLASGRGVSVEIEKKIIAVYEPPGKSNDLFAATLRFLIPDFQAIAKSEMTRKDLRRLMGDDWVKFTRLVLALVSEDNYKEIMKNFPEVFIA